MGTEIDIDAIPTSPTSPNWDIPSTTIYRKKATPSKVLGSSKPTTELGAAIKDVALQFRDMIEQNPSLQDVHDFLSKWRYAETGKIQSMVMEWFAHFSAVPVAADHGRLDLVEALLGYDFELTGTSVNNLLQKAKERCDLNSALEFVFEKGWDINAPVGPTARVVMPILT